MWYFVYSNSYRTLPFLFLLPFYSPPPFPPLPPLPILLHSVSPPFKSSEAIDPCLDPYFTIPAAMTYTAQFVELIADTLDQPLPYPLPRHTIIRCHIDQSIQCMYVCSSSPPAKILQKTIEVSTLLTIRVLTSLIPRPPPFLFFRFRVLY